MKGKARKEKILVSCQYCNKSFFAFIKLKKMTCFDCHLKRQKETAKKYYKLKKKSKKEKKKEKKGCGGGKKKQERREKDTRARYHISRRNEAKRPKE